jgi:hypothetical protein
MMLALAVSLLLTTAWQQQTDALLAKTYPKLARMTVQDSMMDALFYPAKGAEVIGKKRSELPEDHPMYVVDDLPADDVILIRYGDFYVGFSEGPSADPEFYLESEGVYHTFSGTFLVIPGDGTFLTFNRNNAMFVERRLYRMVNGAPVEMKQPYLYVGVQSVALKPLRLRAQKNAGEVIAGIAAGEPLEVVIADAGGWFLIKTKLGLLGWTQVDATQEPAAIKDLWYAGD